MSKYGTSDFGSQVKQHQNFFGLSGAIGAVAGGNVKAELRLLTAKTMETKALILNGDVKNVVSFHFP